MKTKVPPKTQMIKPRLPKTMRTTTILNMKMMPVLDQICYLGLGLLIGSAIVS